MNLITALRFQIFEYQYQINITVPSSPPISKADKRFMFFMLFFILYLIIISEIFSVSNVTDRSNIIHISMLHSYSPMLHLSYSRYIFLQKYYIVALLSLCIGRTASIYQTCRIYISDAQYLYIQCHRYIDICPHHIHTLLVNENTYSA